MREPSHTRRPWVLAALMLFMMLAAMDVTIVSTAVPQIVSDLGDFSLFTWVFSIYLLTQTVTIPIYGKLSDLYGRKPILIYGSLLFLAGSAACAMAWNMPSLIVFRGLQGLGAGAIMATVNTLAGDLYSLEERGRVQGFLSSVWGMAAISGPLLGGTFVEYLSWHWIFLVNLPIGALAIGLLMACLNEQVVRQRHHVDYLGSLTILAAVGTLIFALMQGGTAWPWLSNTSMGVFILALVLTALAIWSQKRAAEPILPSWLWHNKALVGANLCMVGMGFVVMVPSAYLPTFTQSVFSLGAIASGFILAAISLGWPTASTISAHLYLRIGFRHTALIGSILICFATGGFLLLPIDVAIGWIVADQILLGAGFGLLSTPLLVGAQSSVPWQQRGVVTGANMFSRFLGQSLGVAIFGTLFNASLSQQLASAPTALAAHLPAQIDEIINTLQQPQLTEEAALYLRHSVFNATQHLYVGLLVISILTLLLVLRLPRYFDDHARDPSSVAAQKKP